MRLGSEINVYDVWGELCISESQMKYRTKCLTELSFSQMTGRDRPKRFYDNVSFCLFLKHRTMYTCN